MTQTTVRSRFIAYRKVHPVTCAGVCKLMGISEDKAYSLQRFVKHGVSTLDYIVEALDEYLTERGF